MPTPKRVSRMRVGGVGWNVPDVVPGAPCRYAQLSNPKQIASRSIVGRGAEPEVLERLDLPARGRCR